MPQNNVSNNFFHSKSDVDEMIEGAVSRLNNIKNDNTVSFAFFTDIHNCLDYTERAMYAAKKINKQFPLAFCCLGGDYLCNNSSTTKACAVAQHKEMRASYEICYLILWNLNDIFLSHVSYPL